MIDFVAPVLRLSAVKSRCREFYASKQDSEVWLNLFVSASDAPLVADAVKALPAALGVPAPIQSHNDSILAPQCGKYRKLLTASTRYAIDLHLQDDLVAEQQALICIACSSSDPREDLKVHLSALSANYRADSNSLKDTFWRNFLLPGPQPNFEHPGHWIYNIVLGIDCATRPWPSQGAAALHIGIAAPTC